MSAPIRPIALTRPDAADRLFARRDVAGLILGDRALETRFAAAAWRYYALTSAVAQVIFWGRAAAFHGDQFAEERAGRGLGPRDVGARAFHSFEPIDLIEDRDAALTLCARLNGATVAVLDPADPLEARLIALLRDEIPLTPLLEG